MTDYTKKWSRIELILFRFLFIQIALFIVFFNNGAFRPISLLTRHTDKALHQIVPWVAANVLHIEQKISLIRTGSGDTSYDFILLLLTVTASFLGSLIWTMFDPHRKHHYVLYYWLTVGVRYYLAFTMIHYGLIKMVKIQFPDPDNLRLNQNYGNSSPMGLAWTFLGFSTGYNIFMGIAELMATFLLFRRTTTIGAVFCLMASLNIMAVNYFYDVPVKMISTALVLFSVFLLAPNFLSLYRLFFQAKTVSLVPVPELSIKTKWQQYLKTGIKYTVVAFTVITSALGLYHIRKMQGDKVPKNILYGTYNVISAKTYTRDFPDTVKTNANFKSLMIENEEVVVKLTNDSLETAGLMINPKVSRMRLTFSGDKRPTDLHYRLYGQDSLVLTGNFKGDSVNVMLLKKHFRLTERGFHLISEKPYNR